MDADPQHPHLCDRVGTQSSHNLCRTISLSVIVLQGLWKGIHGGQWPCWFRSLIIHCSLSPEKVDQVTSSVRAVEMLAPTLVPRLPYPRAPPPGGRPSREVRPPCSAIVAAATTHNLTQPESNQPRPSDFADSPGHERATQRHEPYGPPRRRLVIWHK